MYMYIYIYIYIYIYTFIIHNTHKEIPFFKERSF